MPDGEPDPATHCTVCVIEDVPCRRAVGIAVPFERVTLERGRQRGLDGRDRQAIERAGCGHFEQALVHPAAGGNGACGVANGDVVAQHRIARRQIDEGDLVSLGNPLDERESGRKLRARRQSAVVGHDGDVVALVHDDVDWLDSSRLSHDPGTSGVPSTVPRLDTRAGLATRRLWSDASRRFDHEPPSRSPSNAARHCQSAVIFPTSITFFQRANSAA
jgi:hypothetical protein